MDLQAGDPMVVGMIVPDAAAALAAMFTLVGPSLPPAEKSAAGAEAYADGAGVDGALVFHPATEPPQEVHGSLGPIANGGLGPIGHGNLAVDATQAGSYWVAVHAGILWPPASASWRRASARDSVGTLSGARPT